MFTFPFARPIYVTLKPVGSRCNLACRYCYFLDKARGTMTDELLDRFIRQYIEAQTAPQVLFIWHGGEPLLQPLSFYRRAVELQQRYAGGRQIDNCIQTNGTLLTPEWCRFLHDNGFLVGISIDGPQHLHDAYRRSPVGRESWTEVMRGISLLREYDVEWNAMAVVHDRNAAHPQEFYHFFRQLGCQHLQFTPIVERMADGRVAPYSVSPDAWGQFLCTVFDEWAARDVGRMFVRLFEDTLANWAGHSPGICTLAPTCGQAAVMDADGNVYSCDHFVRPEHLLGNIRHEPLTALMYSRRQQSFGKQKLDGLPRQCRECRFLFACHGECPKNRIATDRYGQSHLNYLCGGYLQYFRHVMPFMESFLGKNDLN